MVLSLGSMANADWIPYSGDLSLGGCLVLSLGSMANADWIPYSGDLSLEEYLVLSLGSMAKRRLDSIFRGPFSRSLFGSRKREVFQIYAHVFLWSSLLGVI